MAYPLGKLWFFPLINIFIGTISGFNHIPKDKPFILVSNHERRVDPIFLIYLILKKLNKKLHFLAQPKLWFLGEGICRHWAGCIPLYNSKQAFSEMKSYIKRGNIVGIFPQGGYKGEKNNNFKTGAIRLALESNVPILPIGLKSSYLPFRTKINVGKLIWVKGNNELQKKAENLMKTIYKLRTKI